jgi:hypothetical protein
VAAAVADWGAAGAGGRAVSGDCAAGASGFTVRVHSASVRTCSFTVGVT